MRNGECVRRLRHAPGLRNGEQDVEVAQLDATADTVIPAHGPTLSRIANQMQSNSTVLLMQKQTPSRSAMSIALAN